MWKLKRLWNLKYKINYLESGLEYDNSLLLTNKLEAYSNDFILVTIIREYIWHTKGWTLFYVNNLY